MSKFKVGDIVKFKKNWIGGKVGKGSIGIITKLNLVLAENVIVYHSSEISSLDVYEGDLELVKKNNPVKPKIVVPKWFDQWYKNIRQQGQNVIFQISNFESYFTGIFLEDEDKWNWIYKNAESIIRIILGDLEYEVEKEIRWTVEATDEEEVVWRTKKLGAFDRIGFKPWVTEENCYKWNTEEEANEYIRVNKIEGAEAVLVEV
ncbi:hypothetical protein BG261_05445 [Floricoccus tropicus]|uniref:DUF1642 domain-containing protein n=1 Tax=Floricoccus tropicus TaxID=1859473 RepID=A0A1E8GKQ8_9LACT|nr:hypothetical protein [Floricoccus tropicus]OFI48834.1 hypothetical protein BG261_05445 [Floricoccus tropicus]